MKNSKNYFKRNFSNKIKPKTAIGKTITEQQRPSDRGAKETVVLQNQTEQTLQGSRRVSRENLQFEANITVRNIRSST